MTYLQTLFMHLTRKSELNVWLIVELYIHFILTHLGVIPMFYSTQHLQVNTACPMYNNDIIINAFKLGMVYLMSPVLLQTLMDIIVSGSSYFENEIWSIIREYFSATTGYPYLDTPALVLQSSTDVVIRICYEDTTEFWQKWKNELAEIGRNVADAKPDQVGIFLLNCPFHGAIGNYYENAEVPLIDTEIPGEQMFLKDVLNNFMKGSHPFQAIDNMTSINPNCK